MRRSLYRIDRRQYRGIFKPGFFAHLSRSNFWQSDHDPYEKARRSRRRWTAIFACAVLAAAVWLIIESSRAMSLF
jgi:hypothetical protein